MYLMFTPRKLFYNSEQIVINLCFLFLNCYYLLLDMEREKSKLQAERILLSGT